eukprot:7469022-Ditylum_brightwellii.AAC.1
MDVEHVGVAGSMEHIREENVEVQDSGKWLDRDLCILMQFRQLLMQLKKVFASGRELAKLWRFQ